MMHNVIKIIFPVTFVPTFLKIKNVPKRFKTLKRDENKKVFTSMINT